MRYDNGYRWCKHHLLVFTIFLILASIPIPAEAVKIYWWWTNVGPFCEDLRLKKTFEDVRVRIREIDGKLVEFVPGVQNYPNLTFDSENRKIYWTTRGGSLWRANRRDGSDVEEVLALGRGHSIERIAVNPIGRRIYWTMTEPFGKVGAGSVNRANLDGSHRVQVAWFGDGVPPGGLAVDPIRDEPYWTAIRTGALHCCNGQQLTDNIGISELTNLQVDAERRKIYWQERGWLEHRQTAGIYRANLDGTGIELVVEYLREHNDSPGRPRFVLDTLNEKIYWFQGWNEWSAKRGLWRFTVHFRRVDFDGSNVEELFKRYNPGEVRRVIGEHSQGITLDPTSLPVQPHENQVTTWGQIKRKNVH